MDETAKTEARNYLSAIGLFLLGGYWLLYLLMNIDPTGSTAFLLSKRIELIVGISLFTVATLLVILRKRDMLAILFFMLGILELFWMFMPESFIWSAIFSCFVLLTIFITWTSKDKQKRLLLAIPLLVVLEHMMKAYFGYDQLIYVTTRMILVMLCFYLAFVYASEKICLPGMELLTADEKTDFKSSGSVINYMLFSLVSGSYAFYYMFGESVLPANVFEMMEIVCGCSMVFVAILLFAVGKMRFTPVMFMAIGILGILTVCSTGNMFIGIGILYITLGLFAILRKEPRFMPGIMLMIYGCSYFFTAYSNGTLIVAPGVSAVLNLIPCLIAIYLSFAVYSQRKVPLF